MKKMIAFVTLASFVFACTPKAAPTTSTPQNNSSSTTTTTTTTTTPQPSAENSTVEAGHQVYTARCGRCHGLKEPGNYTASRWTGILESMIPKAKLNDQESAQVTAYVMANAKK